MTLFAMLKQLILVALSNILFSVRSITLLLTPAILPFIYYF